jgi:hypothetical protein
MPRRGNARKQDRDFRLQASDFRLQASGFRLQASDFRLQASGFRWRISARRDALGVCLLLSTKSQAPNYKQVPNDKYQITNQAGVMPQLRGERKNREAMNKLVCSGPVRGFLKNRLPAPLGTAALQASRN